MAKNNSSSPDILGIGTEDIDFFKSFTENEGQLNLPADDEEDEDDDPDKSEAGKAPAAKSKEFGQTGIAQELPEGLDDLLGEFRKTQLTPAGDAPPKANATGTAAKAADDKGDADAPKDDENNMFTVIYKDLVDKKLFKEFEGFDGTAEGLLAAIEHSAQETQLDYAESFINEAFEKTPGQAPIAKALIKHLHNGGTVESFQQTYKEEIDLSPLDGADKAAAKEAALTAMRKYFKEEGFDESTIGTMIAPYEALGEDAIIAAGKTLGTKVVAKTRATRTAEETRLAQEKQAEQQRIVNLNTQVKAQIDAAEEILGIKLDATQKAQLADYMFKPTEIVDGIKMSKYAADRRAKAQDPTFAVMQGFLLHRNFEIGKDLAKKAEKVATTTVADKLRAAAAGKMLPGKAGNGSTSNTTGDLGDIDFDAPVLHIKAK